MTTQTLSHSGLGLTGLCVFLPVQLQMPRLIPNFRDYPTELEQPTSDSALDDTEEEEEEAFYRRLFAAADRYARDRTACYRPHRRNVRGVLGSCICCVLAAVFVEASGARGSTVAGRQSQQRLSPACAVCPPHSQSAPRAPSKGVPQTLHCCYCCCCCCCGC
jgi:hypothetical protein